MPIMLKINLAENCHHLIKSHHLFLKNAVFYPKSNLRYNRAEQLFKTKLVTKIVEKKTKTTSWCRYTPRWSLENNWLK